jgi:hypothetical protein
MRCEELVGENIYSVKVVRRNPGIIPGALRNFRAGREGRERVPAVGRRTQRSLDYCDAHSASANGMVRPCSYTASA